MGTGTGVFDWTEDSRAWNDWGSLIGPGTVERGTIGSFDGDNGKWDIADCCAAVVGCGSLFENCSAENFPLLTDHRNIPQVGEQCPTIRGSWRDQDCVECEQAATVMFLVSGAAQVEIYPTMSPPLSGKALYFSHGVIYRRTGKRQLLEAGHGRRLRAERDTILD